MIHNCANIFNTHLTNNVLFIKQNEISYIKNKDKNKFRYYKFNNIDEISNFSDSIHINGTTLRFEILSNNIHHFMYDIFFHFMHFIESSQKNNFKINNLLINLIHVDPHKREQLTQIRPSNESINIIGKKILEDSGGKYYESSIHWCNSVFLAYINDLNLNIIYQDVDKLYTFENLYIIGEDRGLRYPHYANILKDKVHKFIKYTPNLEFDILIYDRLDAGRRIILNANEISHFLIKQNYRVKIINSLTNLSFKEQINTLNNCKVLIIPTGANMSNIILMNRNIIILEIDSRNSWPKMFGTNRLFNNYYYPKFKLVFNNKRGGFYGSAQSGGQGSSIDDNFEVDINDVIKYLKDKL